MVWKHSALPTAREKRLEEGAGALRLSKTSSQGEHSEGEGTSKINISYF